MKTRVYSCPFWCLFVTACAIVKAAAQDPNSTITIHSIDPQAAEAFTNAGTFTIRRTGGTNFSQLIFYELSGTASNGVDYEQLGGTIQMPAGITSVILTVKPVDDALIEGNETVGARIAPSPLQCPTCGYDIGDPAFADLLIYDNDSTGTNHPPFLYFYAPADGAAFNAPANIHLRAYAEDTEDQFFLEVEFFEGPNSLGFGTFQSALCPAPYCPYFAFTWSNVPPGQYTIVARVTDSQGLTSVSPPANIVVNERPPPLRIVEQPTDFSSFWDCKAFFSIRVEVDPPGTPVSYQWQRNGIDISGATNSTYHTGYLTGADNGVPFRCRVSIPGTELFSDEAHITIGGDLLLPELRTAFRYSTGAVALVCNYPVDPGDIHNYEISPSVSIQSAETLSTDPAVILLRTSPLALGTSYAITVTDLWSYSGNRISPNPSRATFFVHNPPATLNRPNAFAAGPYLVIEWRGSGHNLQSADNPFGPWHDLPVSASPALILARPNYCDAIPRRPHQFFRLRTAQ